MMSEEETLTSRTLKALQTLTTEMTLLRTTVMKKSTDAPAHRASDFPSVRQMAQIICGDDAKRGKITAEEGTIATITVAPKAAASKMITFQLTEAAREEVAAASAIVPFQSEPTTASMPIQSEPVPDTLTPRSTPTTIAAKAKHSKVQAVIPRLS